MAASCATKRGAFEKIVEQKDATAEERQISEVNAGIYCFETRLLFPALERVKPENAQGEYYLTDVPAILRADGEDVSVYTHNDAREVSGINTRRRAFGVRASTAHARTLQKPDAQQRRYLH